MKTLEQFKRILWNAVGTLFCQSSKSGYYQKRIHRDISGYYSYFMNGNGVIIRID